MTVLESLPVAFFCFATVFSVLAVLCLLIKLFSIGIAAFEKGAGPEKATSAVSASAPAVAATLPAISAGTLKLTDVDEPTAAMIMAIVSDDTDIPLSELNFKSMKLIQSDKN